MQNSLGFPKHLAWHETLELHELVAFQANYLAGFKNMVDTVQEDRLRSLYNEETVPDMRAFQSGSLLDFAKTAVRNYANAITETAHDLCRYKKI